jgi:L-alanine-DL-glutamate epimerase-like enolase superfamily enzyme
MASMQSIPIEEIKIAAYKVPTDMPETDGTFEWDSTTLVIVQLRAGDQWGLGYSYGHIADCYIIQEYIPFIHQANIFDNRLLWEKMLHKDRNIGARGVAANAISAVDIALWDLKAKILQVPLCELWGRVRDEVPIYGSGGFTSYTDQQLASQFENWRHEGITKFKMKVGRHPDKDQERVKHARKVIGEESELFVDANGAYKLKQALKLAFAFAESNVSWFEEPVIAENLNGLNFLRYEVPKKMNIAAGEYGYEISYFKRMLENQAVDIIQADTTRCLGYTGFLQACQLSGAFNTPLSSHTAPAAHLHPCLTQSLVCHMEYFHDHVRIESRYFEGFPKIRNGCLIPHLDRLGHGLELKEKDIEQFKIYSS